MSIAPRREYIALFIGDISVFATALWVSLALRHLQPVSWELYTQHALPFSLLFIVWALIFFLAGLYGKHTRMLQSRLPQVIFYTQTINITLAALFFFIIPYFGIAPKTVLAIYLVVSSILIFIWRVHLFPHVLPKERTQAILIGSGKDAEMLAEEINADKRYPFEFEAVVDTKKHDVSHMLQQLCRSMEKNSDASVVVADPNDTALIQALPIIYDTAFRKKHFVFVGMGELYEEVFDKVPLSLVRYEWVLGNLAQTQGYAVVKRLIDIIGAIALGVISLVFYPFVILAIKMDDGGKIFFRQERVGRFAENVRILKFRSMDDAGKDVTRVGSILRKFRLDELPQLWNVLMGDLSFVGPRPEMPDLVNHYSARIPYYNARLLLTPGLTGWAQILHDRHPHHGADVKETKNKLSYDLYYLRHRSFLIDMYILFQTARIVLTERGS